MCALPPQAVCVWLPPAAAEALEGTEQPCTAGPRVHGADADRCLSRHVCFFIPVFLVSAATKMLH